MLWHVAMVGERVGVSAPTPPTKKKEVEENERR